MSDWETGINLPTSGVGTCTLANSAGGLGDEMIKRRIDGKSWGEIATEFGLPNPSAARSKFQKLTGITDFKIKGKELKNLVDNNLLDQIKGATVKKVKKVVDVVDSAVDITKAFDAVLPDVGNPTALHAKLVKDNAMAIKKMKKLVQEVKDKGFASAQKGIGNMGKAGDVLDKDKLSKFHKAYNSGETSYLKLTQQSGLSFEDVDNLFWNRTLQGLDGDWWSAYKVKPTSEIGFKAIKEQVFDLKGKGFTNLEINEIMGVDIDVVDLITQGKWSVPTPGSLDYVKAGKSVTTGGVSGPPLPPPPNFGVIYETPSQTGFNYKSYNEMVNWHNSLPHMPSSNMGAFKNYTGSGYDHLNYALRHTAPDLLEDSVKVKAKLLDGGMHPIPTDMRVTRMVDGNAFPGGVQNAGGTAYKDSGFMSTTIVDSGTYGKSKRIKMVIDAPAGTPARFVDTFSSINGEQELLIGRDTPMLVTKVQRTSPEGAVMETWIVHLKVLL